MAVPLDRSGAPPLPGGLYAKTVYAYYFAKVGGGTPSQSVPITFPNDLGLSPGESADLYYYDELPDGSQVNIWRKYGTGTVSSDGTKIVPDTNPATGKPYGVPRFCCGYNFPARSSSTSDRGPADSPVKAGEPVDLQTGLFVLEKTDLVLPDRIPVALRRTYRTNGYAYGPFGQGSSFDVNLLLTPPANGSPDQLILRMPGDSLNPFIRQPDGSFVSLVNPFFHGARVTLEAGNRVLRFKDGAVWTFRASDGLLMAQTDRNGNTLTLERNATYGRITRIVGPTGRAISLRYSSDESPILEATDDTGRSVLYEYDGWKLLSVTDPAGGVTRYTYDANNRLRTITDPRGITFLTNEYDAAGRVIRQTQADGGVWQFAYTVTAGIITSTTITDPRGGTTTSRFNAAGYLISQTDALGQTTTYERAPGSNLLLSTTDPLGRVTRYSYDAAGNVTSISDPLGNTRTFTYEPAFNQVLTAADSLNQTTTYSYDPQGNLTQLTDPLSHPTSFTYNVFGQPLTITNALGKTTIFEYDGAGNLVGTVDPLGNQTQRSYDVASRLIATVQPSGGVTHLSYDLLNRLTGIVDSLGGTTFFGYDPNGNLLNVTDARGTTTTHTYDAMNRLATRTDALNRTETFTYDRKGNLTTVTDRKGQVTTQTFDAKNRRIRTDFADGSFITYAYDPVGNLLGATDSLTGTITRSYDALSRLVSEVTPQGAITYSYDGAGRRQIMQVNGLPPVAYVYDAGSRLTGITQGQQAATLAYDPANRRTALMLPNGIAITYAYDETSRLIAQTYSGPNGVLGDLTYIYDMNGNRVGTGGSWARTGLPAAIPSGSYDAANQQLLFGEVTQVFDANGNLETQNEMNATTTYTWDVRNRLGSISGPFVSASFTYDPFGRRIGKAINGVTTTYLYDGYDIVRAASPSGDAAYLRTLVIDEALTRTDPTETLAYLADILGSTMALVDSAGTTTTEYTYGPFGETQVGGTTSPNPFQFTGRENDGAGTYYYRARYLDPGRGRFIRIDPVGLESGSTNLYVYAGNNPVNATDPMGLIPATYGGWEAQFIFGYGKSTILCCDGDQRRELEYRKFCFGGGFTVGVSGGVASGSEGVSCKNPPEWLLATEFGAPLIGPFGVEAGAGFYLGGGGAYGGGALGVGGKATVCYYRLVSNTVRGCCN